MVPLALAIGGEADIIAANPEHPLAAGGDRIAVLDDGSAGGTAEIRDICARAGAIEVVRGDSPGFRPDEARDRLVRRPAARHRPGRAMATGAGEFAAAPQGDPRAALAAHGGDRALTCGRDGPIGSLQRLSAQLAADACALAGAGIGWPAPEAAATARPGKPQPCASEIRRGNSP